MTTKEKSRSLPPFLVKLRRLVSACPIEVGSWSEDGTVFKVHRGEEFALLVCDEFAKGADARGRVKTVMRTFVRQLQFYAFRKTGAVHTNGPWGFFHPHFCKDPATQHLVRRYPRASLRDESEPEIMAAPAPSPVKTVGTGSGRRRSPRPSTMMEDSDNDDFDFFLGEDDSDSIIEQLRQKVASLELTVKDLREQLSRATEPHKPSFYDRVDAMELVSLEDAASLGGWSDVEATVGELETMTPQPAPQLATDLANFLLQSAAYLPYTNAAQAPIVFEQGPPGVDAF